MVREDKVQAVKDLEDLFKSANALVLAEYRGLTVSQQTKLRRSLKNAKIKKIDRLLFLITCLID